MIVDAYSKLPDGRSRRERAKVKYKCYLGPKQIPPGVRRLSVKRVRYRKRMSSRKHLGDEMLMRAEVEVPSVESLMASPLSRFIQFAANDCGWSGSRHDLIATRFHPLFLKAKSEAGKEDNPNWKKAMNGPFCEVTLK